MQAIKFIPKYEKSIIEEQKTCTARYNFDNVPEINEGLLLQNSLNNITFARAKCKFTDKLTVQDFVNETWEGHKEYETVEHMIWAMDHFYDTSDWNENTEIEVIGWEDVTSFHN